MKARLDTLIQSQEESTQQTLAELKTGLKKKQAEQDARMKHQGDKLKEHDKTNSRLESLLQEVKQTQSEQQVKLTEQQKMIKRFENQLQQKLLEKSQQADQTHDQGEQTSKQLRDGLDRVEQELKTTDKEVMALQREIKSKEKSMWCWIIILMVLPIIVVAIYESLRQNTTNTTD